MLHNPCVLVSLVAVASLILSVLALVMTRRVVRTWKQVAARWQHIAIERGAIVQPRDIIKVER